VFRGSTLFAAPGAGATARGRRLNEELARFLRGKAWRADTTARYLGRVAQPWAFTASDGIFADACFFFYRAAARQPHDDLGRLDPVRPAFLPEDPGSETWLSAGMAQGRRRPRTAGWEGTAISRETPRSGFKPSIAFTRRWLVCGLGRWRETDPWRASNAMITVGRGPAHRSSVKKRYFYQRRDGSAGSARFMMVVRERH